MDLPYLMFLIGFELQEIPFREGSCNLSADRVRYSRVPSTQTTVGVNPRHTNGHSGSPTRWRGVEGHGDGRRRGAEPKSMTTAVLFISVRCMILGMPFASRSLSSVRPSCSFQTTRSLHRLKLMGRFPSITRCWNPFFICPRLLSSAASPAG
jgi:hypothetical protein